MAAPERTIGPSRPYPPRLILGPELPYSPIIHGYGELADQPLSGAITITAVNATRQIISTPLFIRSVTVLAAATNTGQIFIGGPESAFPLAAGASVTLRVKDLSTIYLQGTVVNDLVFYIAEVFQR